MARAKSAPVPTRTSTRNSATCIGTIRGATGAPLAPTRIAHIESKGLGVVADADLQEGALVGVYTGRVLVPRRPGYASHYCLQTTALLDGQTVDVLIDPSTSDRVAEEFKRDPACRVNEPAIGERANCAYVACAPAILEGGVSVANVEVRTICPVRAGDELLTLYGPHVPARAYSCA